MMVPAYRSVAFQVISGQMSMDLHVKNRTEESSDKDNKRQIMEGIIGEWQQMMGYEREMIKNKKLPSGS